MTESEYNKAIAAMSCEQRLALSNGAEVAFRRGRERTAENTLPLPLCRDAEEFEMQGLGRDIDRSISGEPYKSRYDTGRFVSH